MRNTLYLLLAVVAVIAVCAVTADDTPAPTVAETTPEMKTPAVADDKTDVQEKEKHEHDDDEDEIDDSHGPKSSYAHNRFVSYNAPENDQPRSRSRWSSSSSMSSPALSSGLPFTMGDFSDDYDWPSPSYGSAFPTPSGSHSYNMHGMSNNVPSYGMHGMSSNGPMCQPLIDPQYPIFSDTCGAVPQARYSLPNALGQRDKWQVAQLLNVLMSASTEPSCTRSLRLLLCPLLFPSCSARHQSPPVLPCQSFCRAVKSRCAIPVLESLPCEVLPYSSDLCPTTQPYGQHPHSRAFPGNMPSLPMAGSHQPARQFPTLQSLLSSPAALQAALSAQGFPSGMNPQSFPSGMHPQSFQSGMNPQSFQAAMSAQAYQPPLPAQAYQIASPFFQQAAAQAPAPAPVPVMTTPAPTTPAPTAAPVNHYSAAQYPKDTISSMLGDFGPRTYGNDYRQNARYSPYMRSSNDVRPSTDLRASTETRKPAAARPATEYQSAPPARAPVASSMVKA